MSDPQNTTGVPGAEEEADTASGGAPERIDGAEPGRQGVQRATGHPSQAEGEDPDRAGTHPDVRPTSHPSQAEGADREGD